MKALYTRVLDAFELSDGVTMDLMTAVDLGDYSKVVLVVRVNQAGEGDAPTFIVEHSASNEAGSYLPFDTVVEVNLTATGYTWFHQDAFSRWLGWRISGTLTSSAIVTLEIIAKP